MQICNAVVCKNGEKNFLKIKLKTQFEIDIAQTEILMLLRA